MYSKTVIVKDDCLLFVGEIWKNGGSWLDQQH
jgi:hypothetical protein